MLKLHGFNSERFLFLSIICFIFVSSFSLSLTKLGRIKEVVINSKVLGDETYPPVPVLKGNPAKPEISAVSIFAVDMDSGVYLYEKNPDEQLFPASTTKMVTALTALDYYDLGNIIEVKGIRVDGQKMGLKEGEKISVHDLIFGLLIYSANDAAEALASGYCFPDLPKTPENCGREAFIKAMNLKAKELNLDNSNFVNPSGLDSIGHLTTARDLSRIAVAGMKNAFFRSVVSTKEEVVMSQDGKIKHKLVNLNELLGQVDGVLGIKTGWTENAKENLVTYVDRDGKRVVIVLMGSNDRFEDTKKVIDYIFDNYEWKNVRT
jgi:D-alanyl-D-alanine carboxypeptidase (penicillin-binding protein 5/6)